MTISQSTNAVLRTGSREPVPNPTPEALRQAVAELKDAELPVLSCETTHGTLEISIVDGSVVVVGYLPRGGGLECSSSTNVTLESALEVLLQFASGDPAWRDLLEWREAAWLDDESPELEQSIAMAMGLREKVHRAAGHLSEPKQTWILRGLIRSQLQRTADSLKRKGSTEASQVVYDLEVFLLQVLRSSNEPV